MSPRFAAFLLAASLAATTAAASDTTTTSSSKTIATVKPISTDLPKSAGNGAGFGLSLKKKKGQSTPLNSTGLKTRDTFDSDIVENWLVEMNFGTPAQLLDLSLDLGSDGVVAFSTLMPTDEQGSSYPLFNPNDSTTAKYNDQITWAAGYGGFSLTGDIYTDIITLGENTFNNITMEVVTSEPTGSPIK